MESMHKENVTPLYKCLLVIICPSKFIGENSKHETQVNGEMKKSLTRIVHVMHRKFAWQLNSFFRNGYKMVSFFTLRYGKLIFPSSCYTPDLASFSMFLPEEFCIKPAAISSTFSATDKGEAVEKLF